MLLSKTVVVKWFSMNIKHFKEKGYVYTKRGYEFEVNVKDLQNKSEIYVDVQCDICKEKQSLKWRDYLKNIGHNNGEYHCKNCAIKHNVEKRNKAYVNSKLKNGNTFENWCVKNNYQDWLKLWDYELNDCKPSDILYGTNDRYYFKCPRGLHESELNKIHDITNITNGRLSCKQCNSFAQWGIDNLGEDFLEKYWSDKNTLSPWNINYCSNDTKVFIKCQEKDYHEDYCIKCNNFVSGNRCSWCASKKIHPKDSLGQYIVDNYGEEFLNKVWSNKNKKSPFEYSSNNGQELIWNCHLDKHEEYKRRVDGSKRCNFKCPSCNNSKGEEKIDEFLLKNKINYIPQKTYNDLLGVNNGNLSYDFCLPQYNILIEYQGEQHEKYIEGFHKSKKDFEKQVEHDKRKKEYAEKNNIKLLEIWYWQFDNIEKILDKALLGGDFRGNDN